MTHLAATSETTVSVAASDPFMAWGVMSRPLPLPLQQHRSDHRRADWNWHAQLVVQPQRVPPSAATDSMPASG